MNYLSTQLWFHIVIKRIAIDPLSFLRPSEPFFFMRSYVTLNYLIGLDLNTRF